MAERHRPGQHGSLTVGATKADDGGIEVTIRWAPDLGGPEVLRFECLDQTEAELFANMMKEVIIEGSLGN